MMEEAEVLKRIHLAPAVDQGPAQELTWSKKKGKDKPPFTIHLAIFGNQVFFENVPSSATSLLSSVTSDQGKQQEKRTAGSAIGEKGTSSFP